MRFVRPQWKKAGKVRYLCHALDHTKTAYNTAPTFDYLPAIFSLVVGDEIAGSAKINFTMKVVPQPPIRMTYELNRFLR